MAAGIYDLKTGACLNSPPGDRLKGTQPTGRDIFVFNGAYVGTGGRRLFYPPGAGVKRGRFSMKPVGKVGDNENYSIFLGGVTTPAWDTEIFVCADGQDRPLGCWDSAGVAEFIDKKANPINLKQKQSNWGFTLSNLLQCRYPELTIASPRHLWLADDCGLGQTVSIAVAENAIVSVNERKNNPQGESGWVVLALERENGDVIWQKDLDSEPLPGGLLVDRNGQVIVVMRNGSASCFGKKETL